MFRSDAIQFFWRGNPGIQNPPQVVTDEENSKEDMDSIVLARSALYCAQD